MNSRTESLSELCYPKRADFYFFVVASIRFTFVPGDRTNRIQAPVLSCIVLNAKAGKSCDFGRSFLRQSIFKVHIPTSRSCTSVLATGKKEKRKEREKLVSHSRLPSSVPPCMGNTVGDLHAVWRRACNQGPACHFADTLTWACEGNGGPCSRTFTKDH